jgi:hypothetical protein
LKKGITLFQFIGRLIIKAAVDVNAELLVVGLPAPAVIAEADFAGVVLRVHLLTGHVGRVVQGALVKVLKLGVALDLTGAARVQVFVQHLAVGTLVLKSGPIATLNI